MHAILSEFRACELVVKFTDQRHNIGLKLNKISTKNQRSQRGQGMDKIREDKKSKTDCTWANLKNFGLTSFSVYRTCMNEHAFVMLRNHTCSLFFGSDFAHRRLSLYFVNLKFRAFYYQS